MKTCYSKEWISLSFYHSFQLRQEEYVFVLLLMPLFSLPRELLAGLGWKSWKKRWFILTRASLVFFKNDPVSSVQIYIFLIHHVVGIEKQSQIMLFLDLSFDEF